MKQRIPGSWILFFAFLSMGLVFLYLPAAVERDVFGFKVLAVCFFVASASSLSVAGYDLGAGRPRNLVPGKIYRVIKTVDKNFAQLQVWSVRSCYTDSETGKRTTVLEGEWNKKLFYSIPSSVDLNLGNVSAFTVSEAGIGTRFPDNGNVLIYHTEIISPVVAGGGMAT